jgi:hypothetical protein
MHKIHYNTESVVPTGAQDPVAYGLVVDIKPPVDLNEAALRQYISVGSFSDEHTEEPRLAEPTPIT